MELELEDTSGFKNFLRMETAMFHELVQQLSPRIAKTDRWFSYLGYVLRLLSGI
jgi:hypothetical protein